MSTVISEAWVHRIWRESVNGHTRELWLRRDGMGRWLITRKYQQNPEYYLSTAGTWSYFATNDTRHDEATARRLAVEYLMSEET